eukprot:TRINITY_DN9827_c0_g1_i1.p1 TRINITY_DN9827_c0_g1~~TRINITY_DN9827_c0_g1_i1.p1  ORF type:complete len:216 (+),score=49.33 TRINITY_DN9827_c0_g1_i1:569-1216(+)
MRASADEAPSMPNTPTCCHNNWDNLRVKKGVMHLNCRQCNSRWRSRVEDMKNRKCRAFPKGCCPNNDMCDKLHVHAYKSEGKEQRHLDRCAARRQTSSPAPTTAASSGTPASSLSPASTPPAGPQSPMYTSYVPPQPLPVPVYAINTPVIMPPCVAHIAMCPQRLTAVIYTPAIHHHQVYSTVQVPQQPLGSALPPPAMGGPASVLDEGPPPLCE